MMGCHLPVVLRSEPAVHEAAWVVVIAIGPERLLGSDDVGFHIEEAGPRKFELCATEDDGATLVLR